MDKKNLVLGGVLLFLIIIIILLNGPLDKFENYMFGPKNFFRKVEVEKIDNIEIIADDKETKLIKKDEKWKVDGYKDFYVKTEVMDSLLSLLKDFKEADFYLISENIDKKQDFKTDDSGIKVKVSGEKIDSNEFIIGKLSPDFISTYISTFASPETYSVKVDLLTPFSRDEWKDLTIFSSNKEDIASIRFQYPNREFTIAKSEDEWQGKTPYLFDVDQDKIDKILDIMTDLEAVSIPEQSFDNTGLEKNLIIVEAKGVDLNNTIMIGESNEEGHYYAKKADSDNIYLIEKKVRDELNKTIAQLK
jgi:hypothetical protein